MEYFLGYHLSSFFHLLFFFLEYITIPVLLPILLWGYHTIARNPNHSKSLLEIIFESGMEFSVVSMSIIISLWFRTLSALGAFTGYNIIFFVALLVQLGLAATQIIRGRNIAKEKEWTEIKINLTTLKYAFAMLLITMITVIITNSILEKHELSVLSIYFAVLAVIIFSAFCYYLYRMLYYKYYYKLELNEDNKRILGPLTNINKAAYKEYKRNLFWVDLPAEKNSIRITLYGVIKRHFIDWHEEKAQLCIQRLNYFHKYIGTVAFEEIQPLEKDLIDSLKNIKNPLLKRYLIFLIQNTEIKRRVKDAVMKQEIEQEQHSK